MTVAKIPRPRKIKRSERVNSELKEFHDVVEQIGKLNLPPFDAGAEQAAAKRFERCYARASYVRHRLKALSVKEMRAWLKDYRALQKDVRDMRITALAAEIRRRERGRR